MFPIKKNNQRMKPPTPKHILIALLSITGHNEYAEVLREFEGELTANLPVREMEYEGVRPLTPDPIKLSEHLETFSWSLAPCPKSWGGVKPSSYVYWATLFKALEAQGL